ncbi:MAG: hypothetical protein IJF61_06410 [Clostridia bacterium]|nr:hypothetical protein [Clostridia bacterium]
MKKKIKPGMRKIKSLLAVILSFVVWQALRLIYPPMEVHPIFAYIYAIIEMREDPEKTKKFSLLRIKATVIGLLSGLFFLTVAILLGFSGQKTYPEILWEFLLLLASCFVALTVGDAFRCKNFCGIAAIIAAICVVSIHGTNPYLYALMRTLQTLIGVGAATVVNIFIANPLKTKEES